jgi:hypothetical protein
MELFATGLNGPEGMHIQGSGQVAVAEGINLTALEGNNLPHTRRLTILSPGGQRRTLASETGMAAWVDVVRDPNRGYFVAALMGGPGENGVRLVRPNGMVTNFLTANAFYVAVEMDQRSGNLYAAKISASNGSIDVVAPDGTVAGFKDDLRVGDLLMTGDGVLLATIQRRPFLPLSTRVNQVVAFDLATGEETLVASGVGSGAGSLALSPSGEIFVSDFTDGKIRRLVPDGQGSFVVGEFATGFSTSCRRYPDTSFNFLAFDAAGRLYVSDYGAGEIYRITGPF